MTAPTLTTHHAPDTRSVTLGRRGLARLVDVVVVAAATVALGSVIGFGVGWLAIALVAIYGYFVALDLTGATVGKRLLGLQVVGPDGGRPTLAQAAGRESFLVLGAVPFVGVPLSVAAWAVIFVTARRSPSGQGVHDRMGGGTQVVAA